MSTTDGTTDEVLGIDKLLNELEAAQAQLTNADAAWQVADDEREHSLDRLNNAQADVDSWYAQQRKLAHIGSDWARKASHVVTQES